MMVLVWLLLSLSGVVLATGAMRVLQRGGYRWREYNDHLGAAEILPIAVGAAVGVAAAFLLRLVDGNRWLQWIGVAVGFVVTAAEFVMPHVPPYKLTARCRRVYFALIPLNFAFCGGVTGLCAATGLAAWACFVPVFQLLLAPLAALMLAPHEKKVQEIFIRAAKQKLADLAPVVIGVTGSYGKTSFKNILADILRVRYDVCASPESYNTPMGLCKTINDHLAPNQRFLIAEMGARYRGDIRTLTEIAAPDVAVITGIGTQHLATFGSAETLKDTKYEIVQGLGARGVAFFASDDGSTELANRGYPASYSAANSDSPYYVRFENVRVTEKGCRFTLAAGDGTRTVSTVLLGAHNLENMRLACMVARFFGLSLDELAQGCSSARAIPHRLQLLPKTGKLQVLDDSYNASVEGVRAAADVLSLFPVGRAVITPGIVEAGAKTEVDNFRAGCLFGGVCEEAYVYGPNAAALMRGFKAGGLRDEFVHRVRSRDEAVKMLARTEARLVLFSNDLPK